MTDNTSDKYLDAKRAIETAIEHLNARIKAANEIGLNVRIMQMPTGAPPIAIPAPCMPMPVYPSAPALSGALNYTPFTPTLESVQFSLQKLYKEF